VTAPWRCAVALAVVSAAFLAWPGADGAPNAAGAGGALTCGLTDARVTTGPGESGAGHWSVVIVVTNGSYEPCALSGYPSVQLTDNDTGSSMAPVESPSGPWGPGSGTPAVPAGLVLRPGMAASALLGGTDMPSGGASSCPAFSYRVQLPGSARATLFSGPLTDCSGFDVGPFVLGFNGIFPSGSIVGAAPRCRAAASPHERPGPLVSVDAWSGSTLAGSETIFVSGAAATRFRLVLRPGRYRMASAGQSRSGVVVAAGQATGIGRFGTCVPFPITATTVPGAAGDSPTTSTTGSEEWPCRNEAISTRSLEFAQAGGAVSEVVQFTNVGTTPCTLTGYPGVAALDARGRQVEQAQRRLMGMLGGQVVGTAPFTVPLAPGQFATATVEGSDATRQGHPCPTYFPALLVTAPNDTRSVELDGVGRQGPGFAQQGFPGCAPLVVTPVVPGRPGA
jgi:hypothetical protein